MCLEKCLIAKHTLHIDLLTPGFVSFDTKYLT